MPAEQVKISEIYVSFIVTDKDGNRGRIDLTEEETYHLFNNLFVRDGKPNIKDIKGRSIEWLDYPRFGEKGSVVE